MNRNEKFHRILIDLEASPVEVKVCPLAPEDYYRGTFPTQRGNFQDVGVAKSREECEIELARLARAYGTVRAGRSWRD